MAATTDTPQKLPSVSITKWLPVVAIAWLIPGGGHLYLKRNGRGILLGVSVLLTFLFGIMMRGAFFQPMRGDLLTTIIYTGGWVADMAGGILYMLAVWLGYNQPEIAGHVHDYGTKFLVAAGLMNVLAMVDAFEIVSGRKS